LFKDKKLPGVQTDFTRRLMKSTRPLLPTFSYDLAIVMSASDPICTLQNVLYRGFIIANFVDTCIRWTGLTVFLKVEIMRRICFTISLTHDSADLSLYQARPVIQVSVKCITRALSEVAQADFPKIFNIKKALNKQINTWYCYKP